MKRKSYTVITTDERGVEIDRYATDDRASAERYAAIERESVEADGGSIVIERAPVARVHCAGGQYVGLIGDRPIKGTTSNVGLICRARTIEAAARLGAEFVE